jgi:hypothetical protein
MPQPWRPASRARGLSSALLAPLLVCDCAVSGDGIGLASRPADPAQIAKLHDQLEQNAAGEPKDAAVQPGIIVVGTTGPFRALADAQRDEFYRAYLEFAARWHPGEPAALSADAFKERLAGWATIQTFGMPLVVNRRTRVLVPAALANDTRFASTAGSFMFGTTGDLVAAKGDRDGLLWIDQVLCKSGHGFEACAEKYQAGVYDENTGQELGGDRKPKSNGDRIDIASYLRLSKDPDRHRADELDPRAINRCDDCKGSVPGSVQATVSPPQLD